MDGLDFADENVDQYVPGHFLRSSLGYSPCTHPGHGYGEQKAKVQFQWHVVNSGHNDGNVRQLLVCFIALIVNYKPSYYVQEE